MLQFVFGKGGKRSSIILHWKNLVFPLLLVVLLYTNSGLIPFKIALINSPFFFSCNFKQLLVLGVKKPIVLRLL